ncbi:MAG: hypothetical protein KAI61_02045 [Alphaproteobacteria bacterium]|nr:hypothetical protein [Alphaproteobacteria bacterium]MCK5659667.1 hypothetical protein [Alphaproteobacteria bacterium]
MGEKTKKISLGEEFGRAVELDVNGLTIEVSKDGRSVQIDSKGTAKKINFIVNGNPMTAIAAAQKALEVGDRMADGTICLNVDLKNNRALFVPEKIFGGIVQFNDQYKVPDGANERELHGHKDWRGITVDEAELLSKAWKKVASPEKQGNNASWFWIPDLGEDGEYSPTGRICKGATEDYLWGQGSKERNKLLPVPIVRSGPVILNLKR